MFDYLGCMTISFTITAFAAWVAILVIDNRRNGNVIQQSNEDDEDEEDELEELEDEDE